MTENIDACAFHEWPSLLALRPYLGEGWRELILRPHDPLGPAMVQSAWTYQRHPLGAKATSAFPPDGPPGSDLALLRRQVLDEGGRGRVVLGYDEGILSTVFPNFYIAREIARAANDWTVAEWLERDERMYGTVLVSTVLPDDAAAEIRRAGAHERMVAVALGCNGLGRGFGHPVYRPIHEAAVEMGLPLVLQVGSDAASDQIAPPVAGGLPATHGEYRAHAVHSHMSHIASLVTHGVFERYPTLKLLLVGGGAAWIPGYLWRLDYWYKSTERELPWLSKLPSEYFLESVRVSTYQLESASDPSRVKAALEALPGLDRVLTYASCYPNADAEGPDAIAARVPEAWHEAVFADNALSLFRWPSPVAAAKSEAGA